MSLVTLNIPQGLCPIFFTRYRCTITPLCENTLSTGAELAGTQKTRLKSKHEAMFSQRKIRQRGHTARVRGHFGDLTSLICVRPISSIKYEATNTRTKHRIHQSKQVVKL